jgi:hypothetical protein
VSATKQPAQVVDSMGQTQDGLDPFAVLARLEDAADSAPEFLFDALQFLGRYFNSPFAVLYQRLATTEVDEEFHSGPTNPAFWRPALREFLNDGLSSSEPRARVLAGEGAGLRIALISAALRDEGGEPNGRVALVIKLDDQSANELALVLEGYAALISRIAGQWKIRSTPEANRESSHKALSNAASAENAIELAFQLTNTLRTKLDCARVSLGMVHGARVNVISVSGFDEVKLRSPGVLQIHAAMEECLDAGEPVWLDTDRAASGVQYRLHQAWRSAFRNASVASLPLRHEGRIAAIVCLQRDEGRPFTPEELRRIQTATEPYISALLLVHEAKRSLWRHGTDSVTHGLKVLFGRGSWGRKFLAAGLMLAAGYFFFGTYDYHISVPCRISPTTQRHLTMPYQAVLASAPVMAGDQVQAGDVLCVLDHRELVLERNDLAAQRAAAEQRQLSALAEREPVAAALAEAELRVLTTRLDILERKIELATVRSPIDGIVVRGDLRTVIGAVLPQGEPLFEVAPSDALKLELDIPEGISAGIVTGLSGRFATYARPESAYEFHLTHVSAGTELHDGDNIYRAEADAKITGDWVRYGMEGVARVEVGSRPVWWVVLRRVIDALRLNFWL